MPSSSKILYREHCCSVELLETAPGDIVVSIAYALPDVTKQLARTPLHVETDSEVQVALIATLATTPESLLSLCIFPVQEAGHTPISVRQWRRLMLEPCGPMQIKPEPEPAAASPGPDPMQLGASYLDEKQNVVQLRNCTAEDIARMNTDPVWFWDPGLNCGLFETWFSRLIHQNESARAAVQEVARNG